MKSPRSTVAAIAASISPAISACIGARSTKGTGCSVICASWLWLSRRRLNRGEEGAADALPLGREAGEVGAGARTRAELAQLRRGAQLVQPTLALEPFVHRRAPAGEGAPGLEPEQRRLPAHRPP